MTVPLMKHADPIIQYFAWAVEGLPETRVVLPLLQHSPEEAIAWLERVVHRPVFHGYSEYRRAPEQRYAEFPGWLESDAELSSIRWEFAPDYFVVVGAPALAVVQNAEAEFGADESTDRSTRLPTSRPRDDAVVDALAYLESQIADRISDFKSARDFYRRGALVATLAGSLLAALTTFLVGIRQLVGGSWLPILTLFIGGSTTIVTAWAGWFAHRRQWILSQGTLNRLYALNEDIQFRRHLSSDVLPEEDIIRFHDDYQAILQQANAEWLAIRSGGS
jgi:hypothetical protein